MKATLFPAAFNNLHHLYYMRHPYPPANWPPGAPCETALVSALPPHFFFGSFRFSIKAVIRSTGSGKMRVLFLSAAMLVRVCM